MLGDDGLVPPIFRISGRALAQRLPDLRHRPGPVYTSLAEGITALVLDGRVAPETRLPSERELAKHLALSRATVTAAYDALRADGFVISRTGAGTFVTVPVTARRISPTRWAPAQTVPIDEIDMSCAALAAPPGLMPEAVAEAALHLPDEAAGSGYNPLGLPQLRRAVAARFTARGVPTDPDQILVTNGALHGFDMLLRLLVGPGDRVLTELPTYPGALDALRANGTRVVPVGISAERERVMLKIESSKPGQPATELVSLARGIVSAKFMDAFGADRNQPLVVATSTTGNIRTTIRIGRAGLPENLPKMTAACAQ